LKQDQSFFDRHSVAIVVVAAVTLIIIGVAVKLSGLMPGANTGDTDEYQAAVTERIRPFGDVYLPGEELQASGPTLETAIEPEPVATEMTGPQVYNSACIACHGTGVGGAPIVGDAGVWSARIAQGDELLYDHAIDGFQGSTGIMIAKGGRLDLTDKEIKDAVDYMVAESR